MKKIFYWCPYLSDVATITNVINSAISLKKYKKKSQISLLETIGEWQFAKEKLSKYNIKIEKLSNLNFDTNKVGFFKSRLYLLFIFFLNFFPFVRLLKIKKPDFLIIHLLTSLPLVSLIFFKFKTKFILRISGLPKLNFFRKFLWKLSSRNIYLVTCPSKETLEYLKKLNIFEEKKLKILYDPIINVSNINKKNKIVQDKIDHNNFFLNIGRLTNQKNQILLINTFNILIKKNKNLILYIVGEGEKRFQLQEKIETLKLQNNIFLIGHKENVFPYIKKARAVIISSLWEDPGAVMIEASFCNTTVISSNCPNGPNEFILNNQGGYLFESNKLNSLENSINIFLNDSQKQIFKKKIFAKKKTKNYTIYNHYKLLNKILNA